MHRKRKGNKWPACAYNDVVAASSVIPRQKRKRKKKKKIIPIPPSLAFLLLRRRRIRRRLPPAVIVLILFYDVGDSRICVNAFHSSTPTLTKYHILYTSTVYIFPVCVRRETLPYKIVKSRLIHCMEVTLSLQIQFPLVTQVGFLEHCYLPYLWYLRNWNPSPESGANSVRTSRDWVKLWLLFAPDARYWLCTRLVSLVIVVLVSIFKSALSNDFLSSFPFCSLLLGSSSPSSDYKQKLV